MTTHVCNLGTTPLLELLRDFRSPFVSKRKKELIETELKRRWIELSYPTRPKLTA